MQPERTNDQESGGAAEGVPSPVARSDEVAADRSEAAPPDAPARSEDTLGRTTVRSRPTAYCLIPPEIGLVGPMSNYAAPPQLIEGVHLPRSGRNARLCPAVAR